MRLNSVLQRQSDKKLFSVTLIGHWSIIKSPDNEEDYVKWYGTGEGYDAYVGMNSGFDYLLVEL